MIFFYGVPGTGKTHLSRLLGKQLKIPVIEADAIKTRAGKTKLQTCKAYTNFGPLNKQNAIAGLLFVRDELRNSVDSEIRQQQKSFIVEAAFLDPRRLQTIGSGVLLTTVDKQRHKKQFLHHREKIFDFAGHEFQAARLIQDYLVEEAKKLKIDMVDNSGSEEEVVLKLLHAVAPKQA